MDLLHLRSRRALQRRRRDFRCSLTDVNFVGDTSEGLIVAGIWGSRQTTVYVRRIILDGLSSDQVGYVTCSANKLRAPLSPGSSPDLVVERFRVDRSHGAPTCDVVGAWTVQTQSPLSTPISSRRVLVEDGSFRCPPLEFVFSTPVVLYNQNEGVGIFLQEVDVSLVALTASFQFQWSER